MSQWICAQIGAREHFAVPRALHSDGRLQALYTDVWANEIMRQWAKDRLPDSLRALAWRWHAELASAQVTSWNARSLAWTAHSRWLARQRADGRFFGYLDFGQRFASAVRDALRQQPGLKPDTIYFGYDTGALETLEWLRERGIASVVDQMDPNRVETELVREEETRWPGWQLRTTDIPEEYFCRREREWELADRIVVNSEFSRRALLAQGVPAAKLVVIPLSYEAPTANPLPRIRAHRQPLRVLWLGQVILRKGIQYLIEAARLLRQENIQFDIVGPIGISAAAMATAPANVTFHGRTGRDQIGRWYSQADVFVLPTVSDGFALTQLEAMAHGVPVIATPNCGDVVTHETDGLLVPIREAKMLAQALQRYAQDAHLLRAHKEAAPRKARQFTLAHLTKQLFQLQTDLLGHRPTDNAKLSVCNLAFGS